jgi:oligopeptide/dipeptide ABC transporter ATP-binding protein
MMRPGESQYLLEVNGLKTCFYARKGVVQAVDGVSINLKHGEILGLVGESGCGKSVTALSIMRLIGDNGKIVGGQILYDGINLLDLTEKEMIDIRGSEISMIFQQPHSRLNPAFTIGFQISEIYRLHQGISQNEARSRSTELLNLVGIPDPAQKMKVYPHEISGGQAQRVMIAMALALNPKLLIADEPTTALDVTIQAQILDLLRDLQSRMGTSIILITHDVGVIAEMANRAAVMYMGRIVEEAEVPELLSNPRHPYTRGLLNSIPMLGEVKEYLDTIPGTVPSLINLPSGCLFASRCRKRKEHGISICEQQRPDSYRVATRHSVRCHLYTAAKVV